MVKVPAKWRGPPPKFKQNIKQNVKSNTTKKERKGRKSKQDKFHKKTGPDNIEPHAPFHSLENELDKILSANPLAKHVDPPFTELEDELSRLKTQSIELATLVLHLQYTPEAVLLLQQQHQPPQRFPHHEVVRKGRSLIGQLSNSTSIKTTTVQAPPLKRAWSSTAVEPLSIIHSSSPASWGSRGSATTTKALTSPGSFSTAGTAGPGGSPMSAQMVSPSNTQLTPTLDRLLGEVHDAIEKRDGNRIARDLQIEPPLAQAYADLQGELRRHYPWGKDQHLRTLSERVLPKNAETGRTMWESFAAHLLQYLQFIRDYAPENLLKTNNDLKFLLKWVRRILLRKLKLY